MLTTDHDLCQRRNVVSKSVRLTESDIDQCLGEFCFDFGLVELQSETEVGQYLGVCDCVGRLLDGHGQWCRIRPDATGTEFECESCYCGNPHSLTDEPPRVFGKDVFGGSSSNRPPTDDASVTANAFCSKSPSPRATTTQVLSASSRTATLRCRR